MEFAANSAFEEHIGNIILHLASGGVVNVAGHKKLNHFRSNILIQHQIFCCNECN